MKNIINKMILGNKFIVSILVAFVLADSNHKLLPAIITLLLITIGLKITKKQKIVATYRLLIILVQMKKK